MKKPELIRKGHGVSWSDAGTIEQKEAVMREILQPGMLSMIDDELACWVSLQALEALRDALQEIHRQAEMVLAAFNSKSA